ncbi:hypothetical protein ACFQ61_10000 [Streptomyces sp. NPDC056500]|uniref:hypothetical protein n=1 Tax=Streptomyces sp. NPDC056500 TaxID=3345840 RepID=UPI0036B37958
MTDLPPAPERPAIRRVDLDTADIGTWVDMGVIEPHPNPLDPDPTPEPLPEE